MKGLLEIMYQRRTKLVSADFEVKLLENYF